jgi:signal transduction histidine kinase
MSTTPLHRPSLARRLFRTIFLIGLTNVVLTLLAVEFIYEDMERTILRLELADEREYLEQRIGSGGVQTWSSALHTAVFVPDGVEPGDLPDLFAGRSPPFSAEVELGEKSYLISVQRTESPPGILYLADDISLVEDREDVLQVAIALLAVGMLLFGTILAWGGTRRIVAPLDRLTRQIAQIRPASGMSRISDDHHDQELARIAATLNDLLAALDEYVRREKSMVSMASHELRTPVAVIAGALDVLEQRNTLVEADRRTLARIRRATDAMQADVEALLRLARRSVDETDLAPQSLAPVVRAVLAEVAEEAPGDRGRVVFRDMSGGSRVAGDTALVRMLVRNLLQNALRHTQGQVEIELGVYELRLRDEGPGLPAEIGRRLTGGARREVPEDGLGLFICKLICERLGWTLEADATPGGTSLKLRYATVVTTPVT